MNKIEDIPKSKTKKNFDFIDTIRCISMFGIVFEHCAAVASNIYHNKLDSFIETAIIQSFKFSTIAFFLIGGFLINHKFQEYSPSQYLKNRFKNTIKPWLFWIAIFVAITLLDRYIAYLKGSNDTIVRHFFPYFGALLIRVFFYTSYWFILNFLICISILLIFKKYLYSIWMGLILGLVSLFYSINLYYGWIVTTHSTALFGFVFYLWLGVFLNKYYEQIMDYINRAKWIVLIAIAFSTFIVACAESTNLNRISVTDAYNTLRISNILYSFATFSILLKIGNIRWLKQNLQPRSTTFGIYLIHFIIIDRFLPLIFQPMRLDISNFTIWQNTLLHVIRFIIVYVLSVLLTKGITKTRLKWTVGQ